MNKSTVFLFLALFSNVSYSITPEQRGLEIIQEADKRDTGFGDSKADMKMILKNRQGEESIRILEIQTLEIVDDGDKSLIIFDSPADVKGTAFLSFTHALIPDDQWLYLPAVKRVKRISSSNKSGPFLGSEYAFEDLTSFEVPKYSYKYLKDETVDGIGCFIIEATPKYEESGYTREILWIDKDRYISLKIDYYDRKNALLKTLTFKNHQQYLKRYWRASEMLMVNQQNGKSTALTWENYQFKIGLTDRDFDQNTLQRAH
ncbi:outer membrane lipoprotein-sorting protein [Methyloglobulus sp.]|uniref:outer membrane lipoprotein-sorting protein n=1 Tax=Methyloglobulus sp. TaxID=2518622 RepID=UPI0032B85270